MNRKVLFVAPSAYLLSGLATWLDHLIPGLRAQGWDARLGLVSARQHHRPGSYLEAHPCSDVHVAHCRTDTPIGRRSALNKLLQQVRPDIAVSVNIPDLFPAMADYAEGAPTAACVMSVHGIEGYLYGDMRLYGEIIDGVICTNRLACVLAERLGGINSERVLYAPYGISTTNRAKTRAGADCLHIVYSGRLETTQKRCMDLVQIVRELQRRETPFQLDVLGDGPDRNALASALSAEVEQGSVRIHGFVSERELREQHYPSAHALIMPSYWETGPIVIGEAMAHGVCVVSSRYVGSGLEAALQQDENALLFDIGDTTAAAAALQRLWDEAVLRQRLQHGGEKLVTERYGIDVSVSAWSEALNQVLSLPMLPKAKTPTTSAHGRLDRIFRPGIAESIRRLRPGSKSVAADAGGEWPHSHSNSPSDDEFWQIARSLDRVDQPARERASHVG